VSIKRIVLGGLTAVGGLLVCALSVLVVSAMVTHFPGEGRTDGGVKQDRAIYLPMRDGVKVAVDVWLPQSYRPGQRLPTLLRSTRYWRAPHFTWVARGLYGLGLLPVPPIPTDVRLPTAAGYAVVLLDSRGTGASEGTSPILFAPEEVRDIHDLADWIVAQSWSNGKIGAVGVSYNGHMAEFAASVDHPAIKAVAPLYDFFDLAAQGALPGGVRTEKFIKDWSSLTVRLDADDFCRDQPMSCLWTRAIFLSGVKPVDADRGGRRLAQIVAGRHNNVPWDAMKTARFRDDPYDHTPWPIADRSPYAQKAAVQSGGAAMFLWNGWLDSGNVDGAFNRYHAFSNPQMVMVGALSHGGLHDTDPFAETDRPSNPLPDDQMKEIIAFFDRYLKDGPPRPITSEIRYSTLGVRGYRRTQQWPPAGLTPRTLYFADAGQLVDSAPAQETNVRYTVDYSTSTGEQNRWRTSFGGGDVVYPDRRAEDRKLLTFTSAPFSRDTEITGPPVVTLEVASSRDDGAFFVYLEDVAPDGRVTYITEAILRGLDRKLSDPATAPYRPVGPWHSLLRADASPLPVGQRTEVVMGLFSTSVVIRKGHRLRVAVAGEDTPEFARIPATGPAPVWTFALGGATPSKLEAPMRAWDGR
jgi:hypothetical protein